MDTSMLTKEKDAERKRKKRIEWKVSGLCVKCGKIPTRGRHCQRCYENDEKRHKRAEIRRRAKVIEHYNNKCACVKCPETKIQFLTIDHINNDGKQHRKEIGISRGGDQFYKWIIKNNFPKFLQLLCWNCNLGKEHNNGVCPHEITG